MAFDGEIEDLDVNIFYQLLQDKYKSAFDAAQQACCLICVPVNRSLQGVVLDQRFAEMHILSPSPYFKGQFVTTDKKQIGTILLENQTIQTLEGFSEELSVKVLTEETGYNKEYKLFRILILERPLSSVQSKAENSSDAFCGYTVTQNEPLDSYANCKAFLSLFKECQKIFHKLVRITKIGGSGIRLGYKDFIYAIHNTSQALERASDAVAQFSTNYMVVHRFLPDAASRLRRLIQDASRDFASLVCASPQSDTRLRDQIDKAMESYVMAAVHAKLYPVVQQHCADEDRTLQSQLDKLRQVAPLQLGVPAQFCCPFKSALTELERIGDLHTPVEKLFCMKSTLDYISSDVIKHLKLVEGPLCTDSPHLASDDLLSILVYVACQCEVLSLASNIYYIDHFHWSRSSTDYFSYTLVTFKAAVQHILTLKPPPPPTRSDEVESVAEISSPLSGDSSPSSTAALSLASGGGHVDKQLDHVLRLFDTSMKQFQQVDELATLRTRSPRSTSQRKSGGKPSKPQLGDFLSSLQDDAGTSSYGKQT